MQSFTLVKGRQISLNLFKDSKNKVASCDIEPALPLGLCLVIENGVCILAGLSTQVSPRVLYQIKVCNSQGICCDQASIEIAVVEAPIRDQRGRIIKEHDKRGDLIEPRSQWENPSSDMYLGSMIKPHEKFINLPRGDDSHLARQAANNPDAEHRAQKSPELTPSPSAQLQHQAILAAAPSMTPTPTR